MDEGWKQRNMRCYRMSDPAMRGYRKRMRNIRHERTMHSDRTKAKEVNNILRLTHTNDITQTNNLAYAGARLVVELMEIKIPQNNPNKWQPNQPPWKTCLEKQLTELRADLSKLNEMSSRRLQNKKVRKELNERYRIQEKGLNHIIEDVKQRVKAKAHKI